MISNKVLAFAMGASLAAASAQGAFTTTNLLNNPGAESGSIAGWTVGGTSNPGVDSGTFDPGIDPHSGSFDFYGGSGFSGTLSQTVSLIGNQGITAAAIDGGGLTADISFWEQGLNQGDPSDNGQITLTFLNSSNVSIGTASSVVVDSHAGAWENDIEVFAVPTQTASIVYTMNFLRNAGSDNDSFLDDNSLIISDNTVTPPPPTATPEPASFGLLGLSGILGTLMLIKKRSRA